MRKLRTRPVLLAIIVFLCIPSASCCNNFNDFCDKAEEQFEELGEDNTLTQVLDRRLRERRSIAPSWEKKEAAQKVTQTLDTLFAETRYDKRFRPGFGGPPTNIEVNIFIRSMGPVDESLQKFTFDCYFRQKWTDLRLVFNSTNLQELPMNWQFLSKIWRPDTYFLNGMNSYLHKIAVPNRFIRIAPNGRISYSQRLTVSARCQMNLRKFPLDTQACPLEIGSFGFDDDDLTYSWAAVPLSMDDALELAQYQMTAFHHGAKIVKMKNGERSVIYLNFDFQRAIGFYVLQVYIPLYIIVMSSWVTFWLVKTEKGQETPARTQLGATTVLAVVTIGFGGKAKPQVGYATALDVFIIICFMSVLTALIEFAFINFLDMFIRRLKHRDLVRVMTLNDMTRSMTAPLVHIKKLERSSQARPNAVLQQTGDNIDLNRRFSDARVNLAQRRQSDKVDNNAESHNDIPNMLEALDKVEPGPLPDESWTDAGWRVMFNRLANYNWLGKVRKSQLYHNTSDVINSLDARSRKIFPGLFTLLNILYWCGYLYVL